MYLLYGLAAIFVGTCAISGGVWGALIGLGVCLALYQIGLWSQRYFSKDKIKAFWPKINLSEMIVYEGRINRKKYVFRMVGIYLIFYIPLVLVALAQGSLGMPEFMIFGVFISAIAATPTLAQRFHDLNMSAWWIVGCFVPVFLLYPSLLLLFRKGTAGPNRFGADPLDFEKAEVNKAA